MSVSLNPESPANESSNPVGLQPQNSIERRKFSFCTLFVGMIIGFIIGVGIQITITTGDPMLNSPKVEKCDAVFDAFTKQSFTQSNDDCWSLGGIPSSDLDAAWKTTGDDDQSCEKEFNMALMAAKFIYDKRPISAPTTIKTTTPPSTTTTSLPLNPAAIKCLEVLKSTRLYDMITDDAKNCKNSTMASYILKCFDIDDCKNNCKTTSEFEPIYHYVLSDIECKNESTTIN